MGICSIYTCNDSEINTTFGNEKFFAGIINVYNDTYNQNYPDYCLDNNTLVDFYIQGNSINSSNFVCDNGGLCLNGACTCGEVGEVCCPIGMGNASCNIGTCDIESGLCSVEETNYLCSDSDSIDYGYQPYEKFKFGNLTFYNSVESYTYPDLCVNNTHISELYCVNSSDGEFVEESCGQQSVCNNLTGACTCGGNREVCCPTGMDLIECNEGLACNNGVCAISQPLTTCGNGIIESGEICDDGNNLSCSPYPGCKNNCLASQYCGNGIKECSEECDDGNIYQNDYCNNNCVRNCGNGNCGESGESCSTCTADCGSCPSCFLAGTEIETEFGSKSIEEIKIGERVLTFNEIDGKMEYNNVVKTFEHETNGYLIINGKMKVTANHPVYLNGKWDEVGNAKIGDIMKLIDEYEIISKIENVDENVRVYNLEVSGNHNYYAQGILVHNKDGFGGDCPDPRNPDCIV